MAPTAATSLWKTIDEYKFSTGDKYTAEEQLVFHNEGFTDYFVDFTLDLERFETSMGAQFQHVSSLSLYMHTDQDEFVGFSRSAIRGHRVWVCGLAVAPPFRSKGVGAILIREYLNLLRERSKVTRVQLEAIKENHRAVKLYSRMGFQTTFDLQDYVIDDLSLLPDPSARQWKASISDQLDASLPWLQHRFTYSWQREISSLLNSCRGMKQVTVKDENGKVVLALAIETPAHRLKDPPRVTGFAFERGVLSSVELACAIRAALESTTKAAEIRLEPNTSEVVPLLETIDGCRRETDHEEYNMVLDLERP